MISNHSRAILDRYALASAALSQRSGERTASEAGQSVEFRDFRPYQPGDELRYVDWKVYARTGRLYTRLYQAERTVSLHIVLDTSSSMSIGYKAAYARSLAQLLSYVAQRDSVSQVHLFDGSHNTAQQGRKSIAQTWDFIENAHAQTNQSKNTQPVAALKNFALRNRFKAGAGLALVISDLFDESSLQPALAALRARGLDASFLQVMAESDLNPEEGRLELVDLETQEKLLVTPEEVRNYKRAVQQFVQRTRSAVMGAGYRHVLLRAGGGELDSLERSAFAALVKAGILIKR